MDLYSKIATRFGTDRKTVKARCFYLSYVTPRLDNFELEDRMVELMKLHGFEDLEANVIPIPRLLASSRLPPGEYRMMRNGTELGRVIHIEEDPKKCIWCDGRGRVPDDLGRGCQGGEDYIDCEHCDGKGVQI